MISKKPAAQAARIVRHFAIQLGLNENDLTVIKAARAYIGQYLEDTSTKAGAYAQEGEESWKEYTSYWYDVLNCISNIEEDLLDERMAKEIERNEEKARNSDLLSKYPKTVVHDTGKTKYLLFDSADFITSKILRNELFEPDIHAKTIEILKDIENGVVLDIGANMGTYAVPLAQQFPNLDFVSFEPQKIIYYQLCGNIMLNRLNNITANNYALGEKVETLISNIPDYSVADNIGGFRILKEQQAGYKELIKIVPLDTLNIRCVRLIKIDVEGMEIDVLKGAIQTIHKNEYPPIIFESLYVLERQQLFAFLGRIGYSISEINSNNYLAQKTQK
jgi:FkbM family methyltransferase